MRLTTKQKQWLIGTTIFIAGLVVGLIWRDTPGTVIGAIVSFIGILTAFWFEINEMAGGISSSNKHVLEMVEAATEKINDHINQVRTSVVKQLEERTILINPLITNHKQLREDVARLLATVEGMEFVKRSCLLADAAKELEKTCYEKPFPQKYDEEYRVLLLADVLNNASKYVFAFSYADHDHLDRFWNEHKNHALPKYYRAHEDALAGGAKHGGGALKKGICSARQARS